MIQPKKEALLYEPLRNKTVQCHLCFRRCVIHDGERGFCQTRLNENGMLYTLIYGRVSSENVAPIEIKPFFHFFPGTQAYSLGSLGCNFHCPGCQNWEIAHSRVQEIDGETRIISPQEAVDRAEHLDCQGLSWTYNEPTLWWEYVLDGARLSKSRGLYTTLVTNGYFTPEALDRVGPYMDAVRIDVKGFTKDVYRRIAGIEDFEVILANAERAQKTWGIHVEIITNVIPGINDVQEQLQGIARWIFQSLGRDTPWHVTRFYPHHEWAYRSPTRITDLEGARQVGLDAGLRYVYLGNVPGHPGENTTCPNCGEMLIERHNHKMLLYRIKNGVCVNCGEPIPIVQEVKPMAG